MRLTRLPAVAALLGALVLAPVVPGAAPAAAQSAPAAAPAPSASGQIVELRRSARVLYGKLYVAVEVRNDWNRVAYVQGTADVLDSKGEVVGGVLLTFARLQPGEVGVLHGDRNVEDTDYASTRFPAFARRLADTLDNTRFSGAVTSDVESPSRQFFYPEARGRLLEGTITNHNRDAVDGVTVEIWQRDPEGTVYAVEQVRVDGVLQGGQTATWKTELYPADWPYVPGTTWEVHGAASEMPSPLPVEPSLGIVTSSIVAGQTAEVHTLVHLAGTERRAPVGLRVELWGREQGQRAFRLLRSGVTDKNSAASWTLKPQRDTVWQVRVPTTDAITGSVSRTPVTKVGFAVASRGAASGGAFVATGRVLPVRPGHVVQLQQLNPSPVRVVARARVGRDGTYRLSTPLRKGTTFYRVLAPAVPGNQEGAGGLLGVQVR